MARFRTESTPNPNSLKITQRKGVFIDSGLESYASAAEAATHPLAQALFAIPGVSNVLILPDFMTVTKDPSSAWSKVWPLVEQVLESHYR